MQHTLLELVLEEHVVVRLEAADASSAIRALNGLLVQSGKTLPAYGEDAATREAAFPTGLPTQPIAVAIPHATPPNVLASGIAIATLRHPVVFAEMGTDGSSKLDVHMVILLAVKEQEKQVEMIAQLMRIIQNASVLSDIMQAGSGAEVVGLIRQSLVA